MTRLLQLRLIRFGPFEDLTLDFDPGAGLHLVYGSNEAGKSTSLRALLGFLFGIPGNTADAHRFRMPDLRVGATLAGTDGSELRLVRRKGNKDTLMTEEGSPVDEAVLSRVLGGISQAAFEQLYGLSHARLVAGGEDLLAGKGELGESLFAAGSGVRGLHRLRAALAEEASGLFAPRAKDRPLNRAIEDFKSAKNLVQEKLLLPSKWQKLVGDLEEGRRRLASLDDEVLRRDAEVVRAERISRVLPLVGRRDAYQEELAALRDVGVLPADAGERRAKLQEALRSIELQTRQLTAERSRLERQRSDLHVPADLLSQGDRVEALQESLGAQKKARIDLPKLQADVDISRQDADRILRDLGRSESWDQAEDLRVDSVTRARVRALTDQQRDLDNESRAAARELLEARRELERLRGLLLEAPQERDVEPLRRLAKEIRRHGDLEGHVDDLRIERAVLDAKTAELAAGLSGWRGEMAAVRGMAVPLRDEVLEFQTIFARLDERSRELEAARTGHEGQIRTLERQLEEMAAQGALPSEDELARTRGDRQRGWVAIKGPWLEGALPEPQERSDLADCFEIAVASADEVADQLRHDASRVVAEARLKRDLVQVRADLERTMEDLDGHRRQCESVDDQWLEVWEGTSVEPGSPSVMLSWLAQRERVVQSLDAFDAVGERVDQDVDRVSGFLASLDGELAKLGQQAPEGESLAARLTRADEVVERALQERMARAALVQGIKDAEEAVRRRADAVQQLEERMAAWQASWRAALEGLGFQPDAGPVEVLAYLDGLQRLFEKIDSAVAKQLRIEHISRDAEEFEHAAEALVLACLPSLGVLPPDEAARRLVQALREGREALVTRETIDDRMAEIDGQLDGLRVERTAHEEELEALVKQAGCSGVEELPDAEARSRRRDELVGLITGIEEQLAAEGRPLDELLAQVRDVDPDELPALLAQAEQEKAAAREAAGQLREEVGGLQMQLDAIAGGDEAALAACDAEEALARIAAGVEQYVDLKMASLLLAREIERYRVEHQGPIVGLASRAFNRLTLGSFAGVATGFDAKDQQILVCRRAGGHDVDVTGLSDGTRDQLYLALRLASIEYRLSLEESLPLVVDDILVNFDDDRARAALELLGELAEKTQVLFFTHHRRLAELAGGAVPAERLQEHDLDVLGAR